MAASTAVQVVVSPFLGVLFDNLSSLIQKEVVLIWGVDKEMKKLASTLSTIRDVLEDAEEKQIMDKAAANWLLKLRALAYDADDSSLTELEIFDCPSLANISQILRYQTTLQSLQITGCPKALISTLECQHLNSLRSLYLQELTFLPGGLQNLCSTLQKLTISYCSVLNSLPDWMRCFTKLEHLNLYCCENLRSLLEGLQHLNNLLILSIWRCHPELHERCKKEIGEDWPKIAHVLHLSNDPCRDMFSSSFGDA